MGFLLTLTQKQKIADLQHDVPDVLGLDSGELGRAALPHRGQGRVPGQVGDVAGDISAIILSLQYLHD